MHKTERLAPSEKILHQSYIELRAGARAVDLGGPSVYQEGPKFEVKHNSCCLQKSKLVGWGGGKHVD